MFCILIHLFNFKFDRETKVQILKGASLYSKISVNFSCYAVVLRAVLLQFKYGFCHAEPAWADLHSYWIESQEGRETEDSDGDEGLKIRGGRDRWRNGGRDQEGEEEEREKQKRKEEKRRERSKRREGKPREEEMDAWSERLGRRETASR